MQISGQSSVSSVRPKAAGAAAEAATPAASVPSDRFTSTVRKKQIDVPLLNQYTDGDQNACGTTSLAMILNFYGKGTTRQTIDQSIRRIDGPTAPDDIVEYARAQGLNAELYNKGSVNELKKFLDKGIPLEVLIDPDNVASDTTLHYVVVTGYETDPETGKTNLLINDPAGGEAKRWTEDEFVERWDNLKVKGVDTGVDRLFMAIAPKSEELPPTRRSGARTALAVFEGLAVGESAIRTAKDAWKTVKGWFD